MARRRPKSRNRNKISWQTLIRRIKRGKFLPIVSDRVFFPGGNTVIESWAEEIGYPYQLDHRLHLAHLAQFLSATSRDDLAPKEDFLDFSKQYTFDRIRDNASPEEEDFLDMLEDELMDITFSETAARLNYPKYEDEFDNPLRVLAEFPLPIYITTSYYDFIEEALKAAGKEPVTEICYWNDDLDDIPSIFDEDPDYQPSEETPLVYHLNGFDAYPASLVLTEDDYLDFLVKISQDIDVIPRRVAQALVDSSLLLLGYLLDDWNFKVMFRGLIKNKRASRRRLSLSIQITPDSDFIVNEEDAREYLDKYFGKANFDIYWGNSSNFIRDLWEQWEG